MVQVVSLEMGNRQIICLQVTSRVAGSLRLCTCMDMHPATIDFISADGRNDRGVGSRERDSSHIEYGYRRLPYDDYLYVNR